MTVRECYEKLNGDYNDATHRLMKDSLIERFMLKFPADTTMAQLRDALAARDYETAFRAVHTLKGVAGNLAFRGLAASASALTEQLRADKSEPDAALVEKVNADYELVLETLKAYQAEK